MLNHLIKDNLLIVSVFIDYIGAKHVVFCPQKGKNRTLGKRQKISGLIEEPTLRCSFRFKECNHSYNSPDDKINPSKKTENNANKYCISY